MKGFVKNSKGAVTVFVTLLLIPAILVSGTAVDLTRIYTARSIVADAGQMAANAVLSQYNALLHDLYGIFGVAEDDPVLAELLDEYISVTVFGEAGKDTSMGTLQLFYGSGLSADEVYFEDGKDLRDPDVLRRQIEEYMKFRAPVIIVKELIELLGSSTFKEDSGVIDDKLQIDEGIAELYEKYRELYEAIRIADRCTTTPYGTTQPVGTVSSYLGYILDEFISLDECHKDWEKEKDNIRKRIAAGLEYSTAKRDDCEKHYRAILQNISAWARGGTVGKNWSSGSWRGSSNVQGLDVTIRNAIKSTKDFKPNFDEVAAIARELDAMNAELTRKVNELEARLENGQCNEELNKALTQRTAGAGKSVIETYRDILKWDDIESMANIYRDGGHSYIDGPLEEMLDGVIYRNRYDPDDPWLTQDQLANAPSEAALAMAAWEGDVTKLARYTSTIISYGMPAGFVKFGEHPGGNKAFYEELKMMMDDPGTSPATLYEGQKEAGGGNAEKKQRNMIDELFGLVDSAYAGITNNQLGAGYIGAREDETKKPKAGSISESASEASSHPVADVISDPYGSIARAGDYLLLLTYCTSMFSNYTTARPETNGRARGEAGALSDIGFPKSISGIPLSPQVNYFFQSEWEYLYNGSRDAGNNLNAVSRLIYLVRVICNYITVFSVSEVTAVVNAVRAAFSWCVPLGLVLGELARAAFVAAESAVDLAALRAGHKVPLIKSGNSGQWVCSPSGVASALSKVAADIADAGEGHDDKGISYSNYLLFFFLSKGVLGANAANELTQRTADLIEWNVINYQDGIDSDEEEMSGSLAEPGRFKLEDMKTDFSLTVTVDMRMLFLSMPVARNFAGSRGMEAPPRAVPVTVTEYRGY